MSPGHYAYETYSVRAVDEKSGADLIWFQFKAARVHPSEKLAVYGNPYSLRVTIYPENPYDIVRIVDASFATAGGGALFAASTIDFELIPIRPKGRGLTVASCILPWTGLVRSTFPMIPLSKRNSARDTPRAKPAVTPRSFGGSIGAILRIGA